MNCIQLTLFVLQLALLHSAQSKNVCDYGNAECTTSAVRNVYKSIVAGVEGVVESSDPLHVDEIKEDAVLFKFQFTNATMRGLTNCEVTQFKLNDEELNYQYGLLCPQLILTHKYDVEGYYGPVEAIGKGQSLITLNNYAIDFKGSYEKFVDEKDQKVHLHLTEYDVRFELKGNLLFDIQGPLHSDEAKSKVAKDYIYGNLNDFEKLLRSPIVTSYMAKFIRNFDAYLKVNSFEEIFYAP